MSKENFIPGIYNYCDRWCERCKLAHRCRLYHNELSQSTNTKNKSNFVDIVSQSLKDTVVLLHKIAQEKGINLDDLEIDEKAFQIEQKKYEDARLHPIVLKADAYVEKTVAWFERNQYLNEEKNKCLTQIELGIQVEESKKTLEILEEALNIINWYIYQIPVKLSSAIGYFPHDPEFEDEVQNMYHATAKVSLIGIENSMKAWRNLLDLVEDEEDFILQQLLQLQRLQKQTFSMFPLIHQFKRPGFDDENFLSI